MPTVTKEKAVVKRVGRKPLYPYDEWFSEAKKVTDEGKGFKLVGGDDLKKKGVDFICTQKTIRHSLYKEGKRRGLSVKTVLVDGGIVINGFSKKVEKPSK